MKRYLFLTVIIISSVSLAQVGIGTTTPNSSAALDITSTDSGILIPRMTEAQRTAILTPATGLLVYQTDNTTGFWFYNGSGWANLSVGGATGEFQSIGGVVQNISNPTSDDFVFGSTTLSGSEARFFFDKSKGAFRAGIVSGSQWDDSNVGSSSIALGPETTASGVNSIAFQGGTATETNSVSIGPNTQAASEGSIALGDGSTVGTSSNYGNSIGFLNSVSAAYGTAIGYENAASGERSFAFGANAIASGIAATAFNNSTASGNGSFAGIGATASGQNAIALQGGNASGLNSISIGADTEASGESAIAIGDNLEALSFRETVLGFNSVVYVPSSTTTSNANDRLFVIGNGDATLSIPSTNNAFTILKDGRTGIMRIPTTNMLEIEGNASKSTAGDWLANSDKRLKKNIETFNEEEALNKLMQLRGVTYVWDDNKTGSKRPNGIQYGFIAQEIEEVFPENVAMDNLGYYQTSYGTYDAMYVQSIKALNSKIEHLEEENLELKEQIKKIYELLKTQQESTANGN